MNISEPNAIPPGAWQIVKAELKKFGPIHWAFLAFVTLPLAAIAAPFYLVAIIGSAVAGALNAGHTWLVKKLPNYGNENL